MSVISGPSGLLDFYRGKDRAFHGRGIEDVWRMSMDELEYAHDYIQWLFPLRERSAFNPDAPPLDAETIEAFQSAEFRERLVTSSETMARFYGFHFARDGDTWRASRAPDFEQRRLIWLTPRNHNFLRLTRIMKSLQLLGLRPLALAWFDALSSVYGENPTIVGEETMRHWTSATRQ